MKCAVIGGGGFIGRSVCRQLVGAAFPIKVLDRPGVSAGDDMENGAGVEWIEGDFSNAADLERVIRDCEVVFHLVSTTLPQTSNEDPLFDLESNVGGTLRLLDIARKMAVRKIVFASSGGTVYGVPRTTPIDEGHATEPICAYGVSKLAIEKYLELYRVLHGLEYSVLRIANPYGVGQSPYSKQGAIAVFLSKALSGETIEIWGDGRVVRDYLYVADVAEAMLGAAQYTGSHRIFNIGSGCGHSLVEIVSAIEHVLGRRVERRFLAGRSFDVPSNVLAIDRARAELGWSPRTALDEGLRRTVAWLESRL